ncbi:lipoprotein signal peptidase [Oceanobacillus piezotolerans]|uniref:Lipoprotein signal peptidase n=1 Tax=Oceanobacillus piezotolerans TaxID=2448030 RepID=A0A498DNE2_9BACI|nr:signal peptidase II [Oceanobacillus piezotolerans]RLL45252.1 lipoprotein signal peptidase [Oceanobacillus piezotolerans]
MYWYYLVAIIIIGIDQLTKWIVVKTMEIGESITVIDGFFYLTSHRNQGAAWGILQGQMGFFYIITIIVVLGVIFYMQKYAKYDKILGLGLSFILGGAIGNFIDRLLRQEVVDFFNFYIFNYNFPIFNIADSALTIGVVLVIISTIREETKKGK